MSQPSDREIVRVRHIALLRLRGQTLLRLQL
jgi:hypothetical protein